MAGIDPRSNYVYPAKANYYLNIGENELALEMAQKAVETLPKRWGSYAVLGFINSMLGNHRETIAAFDKANAIDPSYTGHVYVKVMSYFQLGEIDKAREEFELGKEHFYTRIADDPMSAERHIELMCAAQAAGLADISLKEVDFLLSRSEIPPFVHYELSGIYARNNRIAEAAKHLRIAIDGGYTEFSSFDAPWFISLQGTPEYDFLLEHIRGA